MSEELTEMATNKMKVESGSTFSNTSPERDALKEEVSDEMWQEGVSYYINLNRKRRKVTQKQIAERLGVTQPAVCQMLKRPATIAKLWRLCHAMGGHLEVDFVYEGKRYSLLNEPLPNNPDAWMVEDANRGGSAA